MSTLRTALIFAAIWGLLAACGLLEPLERLTLQARYFARPALAWHAPVSVVAIDERALKAYGQMPWNRTVFARLLQDLHAQGASVVGIDVAFNEPAHEPAQDRALASALAAVPTVLPTFLAPTGGGLAGIEPLPIFKARAAALGSIQPATTFQPQDFEVEPYQQAAGRLVPAFAIAVAGLVRHDAWRPAPSGWLWRGGPLYIDFRTPAGGAPTVSAADVLAGRLAPHALAGRAVLVGATATGLPDTNFTPADVRGGPMAGVELWANVLDDALADGFLRRLSPLAVWLLLGVLAFVPGRPLCTGRSSSVTRTRWLVGALLVWAVAAIAAFDLSIWLEVVPVFGFLGTCYLWGLFAEHRDLLTSRNQLLARYAADMADEARRQRARLDGELHDGIQQLLFVVARETRLVQRLVTDASLRERLEMLERLAGSAQDEVIRVRADLVPPALREGGLADALPTLAHEVSQRTGLTVAIDTDGWEPMPRETEVELYWMVKEALHNVEKHAAATRVDIRLTHEHGQAAIEVADDGRGFVASDPSLAPSGTAHTGLHRMWLRMRGNDGDLAIDTTPGGGTRLRFTLGLERRTA
ncbi:MAG TPA: CHASE2 domain-containing protein [Oscillatoriaceae cyanobacterium]